MLVSPSARAWRCIPVRSSVALFALMGCAASHPRPTPPPSSGPTVLGLTPSSDPSSTSLASAAFAEVSNKYGHCRTYRDHGTVIATTSRRGTYDSIVGRFDTLFVRDVGIRFQYFDEEGRRIVGVWARGDELRKWFFDHVETPKGSLLDTMSNLRGVTNVTSWVVPRLLYGSEFVPQPLCGPWEATNHVPCAKCPSVAFRCPSQQAAVALSLDLRSDIVRRYYRVLDSPVAPATDPLVTVLPAADSGKERGRAPDGEMERTETLVLYDAPELDVDEAEAVQELQKQPW
jgi:hypothetical protein